MSLQISSEVVPGLMERLPWIFWGSKVNAISDRIKETKSVSFRIIKEYKHLLSSLVPKWLMMYEEVCFGSLLLLLQIDPRGHLNNELKIWSVSRWNEITREFKMLPSEGREGGFARTSIWDVSAIVGDWPGDFFFLQVVTLLDNLCFFPVTTSMRDGAPWPILGLSADRA